MRVLGIKSVVARGEKPNAVKITLLSELARSAKSKIKSVWARLSLSQRFCAAASVVVACGMILIGSWVAGRIEAGVVNNAAAAAALYIDNFVHPHVQELASAPDISEEHKKALDVLMSPQAVQRPIVAFNIWKGTTVVYSDRTENVGKTFASTEAIERAGKGQVAAKFDRLRDAHSPAHPSPGLPVLESFLGLRC
jgi:hypothetical protein